MQCRRQNRKMASVCYCEINDRKRPLKVVTAISFVHWQCSILTFETTLSYAEINQRKHKQKTIRQASNLLWNSVEEGAGIESNRIERIRTHSFLWGLNDINRSNLLRYCLELQPSLYALFGKKNVLCFFKLPYHSWTSFEQRRTVRWCDRTS